MTYKKVLPIAAVLIILAIAVFSLMNVDSPDIDNMTASVALPHDPDSATVRTIDSGQVIGFSDSNNTHSWLGIPYAAPPVGPLRWRAPQSVQPWAERLPALKTTAPCAQHWTFLAGEPGDIGDVVGSEDCLYLNIWAPRQLSVARSEIKGSVANEPTINSSKINSSKINSSKINSPPINSRASQQQLPVMLWIHGGGNSVGAARFYTGQNIASDQQVVFVSINYRLGPLGWFTHSALRSSAANLEDASGNYGLLDIIAALQWIQTNIHAFGGDPSNVTVFGESAGGRNIFGLVASPLTKGLFHKAISQSGSTRTETPASAENFTDQQQPGWPNSSNEILAQLLISKDTATDRTEAKNDLSLMSEEAISAFLYQQTPEMLINAGMELVKQPEAPQTPQLLRDGHVLPAQPMAEVFGQTDAYNAVPMIMGANRDEDKAFMATDPDFVSQQFGVRPVIKDVERYERYADYRSQRWHMFGVSQIAKLMRSANPEIDIYGYRFDWDESPSSWIVDLPTLFGAGHGSEISFVFNDFAGGLRLPFLYKPESQPGRAALSNAMMNYWGRFAHSGSPDRGAFQQQPEWTVWQETDANIMVLDSPADGGWRMEHYNPTPEELMARIESDIMMANQEERCRLFVESFLMSYQSSDYWDSERYINLAGGGCADHDPYTFVDAF